MRDALSRGIYVAPPKREDLLDQMAKLRLQEEDKEKARAGKEARGKKDDIGEGITRFAGVWERDVPGLAEEFNALKELKVKYEQEKDPIMKAKLGQEAVQAGIAMESHISKSKSNKQLYAKEIDKINKDKGFFLPENSRELLDKWAAIDYKDRPDDIGIEIPSDIDIVRSGRQKFMESIGKPNERAVTNIVGGKSVTEKKAYYTPARVEEALDAAVNSLKPNEYRTAVSRIQRNALEGMGAERDNAMKALESPEATKAYVKEMIRQYVTPGLTIESVISKPALAGRGGRGGGGGGGKGQYYIKESIVEVPGPSGTKQQYLEISSSKKSGTNPQKDWIVPTAEIQMYDKKYNYNLGVANIDAKSQPQTAIKGTFVRARRAIDNPNDIIITIIPSGGRAEKTAKTRKPIDIPYFGNEDEVMVYLDGADLIDAFNDMQPSEGTKLYPVKRGTSAKPTFEVPRTSKQANPLDEFNQFKR